MLYMRVDMFPVNILPNVVRTKTSTKASTGPSKITVRSENMLDKPIFAPGKNSGGNKLSTINMMSPMAQSTESIATRFAENLVVLLKAVIILPFFLPFFYKILAVFLQDFCYRCNKTGTRYSVRIFSLLGLHTIAPPAVVTSPKAYTQS
ncbi:unknown [Corallococcus sp. CAG:1435]|nr:unknown [Corallococcus sp. CAG:1435]